MEFPVELCTYPVKQEQPDEGEDPAIWNGGAEMITVKVEPVDAALTAADDCGSPAKLNSEKDFPAAYPSHLQEDHSPAHFYIAKLSQKLNLKLNKVLSPQNDNSVSNTAGAQNIWDTEENFPDKALECPWCSTLVTNIEDLEQHQLECGGSPNSDDCTGLSSGMDGDKRRYSCDLCDKSFARHWYLKRHYLSHAHCERFICVVCKENFPSAKSLKLHQITHLKDMPYVCPKCNRGFPNRDALKEHARVHIKDMPFSCRFCGKRFMQANNLNFHMKVHSGVTIYPCDECERSFGTEEERTAHKGQHKLVVPYKCGLCNQSFPTKRQRQRHSAIHDVENPQKCAHCDKRFAHEANYRAHIKAVHSKISSVCSDCDLLAHTVTCDDAEEFMCDECDLPFLHKKCLASHILAHPKNERVSCEKCGKGFPHMSAYHRHMLVHTGEKAFVCTECKRYFFTRSSLKEHMRSHWRERPFACKVCGEKFSFNNMMAHLLSHSGGQEVLNRQYPVAGETGNTLKDSDVKRGHPKRKIKNTKSAYLWCEATSEEDTSLSDAEMNSGEDSD